MMRTVTLLICTLCTFNACASDLSKLYSDQTLRYWQGRYEPNIRWNFNHLILGSLTPDEKRRVGRISLEMPLRAPGESAGELLTYYARGKKIVIPVQSIKFFDDIAQAWAYAWSNNLDQERVINYISILKYHKPPAGGFQPPLVTLGIPEDAWKSDRKMDDVSQKTLKSALMFIMAHELAHILYKHPGYAGVSADQAQANELQADRFANEIMRRIGVAPIGMVQMFTVFAHASPTRGDFNSGKAWVHYIQHAATHPVSSARLHAMAADLKRAPGDFSATEVDRAAGIQRVIYIAEQIDGIARILDDLDMQRFIAGKARGLNPALLNYHPEQQTNATQPFADHYQGIYRHRTMDGATEGLAMQLQLQRSGERVIGRFDFGFGNGNGTLEGVILGKEMRFQWTLGEMFGQGVMQAEGTKLNASVGYENSDTDAGAWHLKRTP